ncbi:hypothetical protein BRADI_3g10771v3 [Brachypodium distachyon]|uniref:Uncharacterized protein n=1 Tax=Brachypodium distachyon TaxID=15368 RepID=A0A2K2CWG8_BRADI|nr:hypothetical protein BRADI_3g10771v3 [Brachypodium distachyon]
MMRSSALAPASVERGATTYHPHLLAHLEAANTSVQACCVRLVHNFSFYQDTETQTSLDLLACTCASLGR